MIHLTFGQLILSYLAVTTILVGVTALPRTPSAIFRIPVFSALVHVFFVVMSAVMVVQHGVITAFAENILIDHLAFFHMVLVSFVFLFSSLYGTGYFRDGIANGLFTASYARRYSILWQIFETMLTLVLLSNNFGFMWVSIEATTLVSAFLILSPKDPLSIEAMWKYLLICSVGIVFAFMGTMLTIAASRTVAESDAVYLFSHLIRNAGLINGKIMLLAFIFIAIGYGTKAGLAPMHTWLPDAHSQAPTPVSAAFSSVMLNVALFCILRFLPVAEGALGGSGDARSLLLFFGIMSLVFAVIFMPVQFGMKRFLAYCSVEHLGIIAIGIALGGAGTFAALLHSANHACAKMLSFFSVGQIDHRFGTRDMRVVRAALRYTPLWGVAFFIAVLALLGVAPGALFFSELLLLRESFVTGHFAVFIFISVALLLIFITALKNIMTACFGDWTGTLHPVSRRPVADVLIAGVLLAAIIVPGLFLPNPIREFIVHAAQIVDRGIPR